MKNPILYLLLFLLISSSSIAQKSENKATLCSDYDRTTGEPIGISDAWDISSDGKGSNVYLIYSQPKTIKEALSVYIDKKNANGSYIAFGTYYFDNDIKVNPKKWAMYDINFKEEGDYKIAVIGKDANALAVTYTNIKFMKDEASKKNMKKASKDDAPDTYYYEDSYIDFGESIKDGVLSGQATEFSLRGSSKEIVAKLSQDEDLLLKSVIVSVYTGDDYKEKVSELTYTVDDLTWNWINVPVKFYKKGKYVVDMYSQDDVFINTAYFEVK